MILPPQTIRILHSSSSMKTFVKFISKRRLTSKQKYESKNPKFTTIGKTVEDFSEFTGIPCPKSIITKYQGFRGRLKLTDHLGGGFILVKLCQQSEQEGFSTKKQLEIMTSLTTSIADFPFRDKESWNAIPKIVTNDCFNSFHGIMQKHGYFRDDDITLNKIFIPEEDILISWTIKTSSNTSRLVVISFPR